MITINIQIKQEGSQVFFAAISPPQNETTKLEGEIRTDLFDLLKNYFEEHGDKTIMQDVTEESQADWWKNSRN